MKIDVVTKCDGATCFEDCISPANNWQMLMFWGERWRFDCRCSLECAMISSQSVMCNKYNVFYLFYIWIVGVRDLFLYVRWLLILLLHDLHMSIWSRLVDKVYLVLYNRKGTMVEAFPKQAFPKYCLIPLFLGNALSPFLHLKHGQKILSLGYHRAKCHPSYTRRIKCFHFHILFEYELQNCRAINILKKIRGEC
jgi:hypothetical protein